MVVVEVLLVMMLLATMVILNLTVLFLHFQAQLYFCNGILILQIKHVNYAQKNLNNKVAERSSIQRFITLAFALLATS